ncbi:MAG TPA: PKD domain-containing protein, partial [Thermoanaerobaculia bacterium]|nr:PKD domain-containing protein [Thermoanaerobaculia bacterium]
MLHAPKSLRFSPGPALAALLLLATVSTAPAAADASCDRSGCGFAACATPAIPPPASFWGELQPADASLPLCTTLGSPFCRDSTAFDEFQNIYSSYPWFMSVDTENGYAFLGLAYGMQIYDARSTPQSPAPVGRLLYSDIPVPANSAETKWPIQSVDAPAGIDTIAALAGESGIGLVAVDTTDKTKPKVLFQSYLLDGEQVYAATLGGRQYAFLAASSGNPAGGVFVYDLTRARSFDKCTEHYPSQDPTVFPQCQGVFVGKLGTRTSAQYVHGVGNFVVLSSGTGRGFEIWNVADPAHPQLALTGLGSQSVYGVALWQQAGRYYLALRTDHFDAAMSRQVNQAQTYDVTCVTGSCAGLAAPLSSLELDSGTSNFYVTYSTSNGVPYIYYGEDDKCRGGGQREWLFDVSNPAAPRDVSPGTGYWGWYYRGNPTGFNNVMPRSGKFIGDYFYRAALSIFDIHKHNPSATPTPFIFIGGPTVGLTNQALTFTASTGICTPTAGGWNWNTSGGFISGSPTSNSITVTWTTAGDKVVTATNVGCASAVGTHTVTLGDSSFLAANFSFSPGSPAAGQLVTFDASSTSGNPTSYNWDFGDGTSGNGQIVNHTYGVNGAYIVRLSVSRPGTGPGCNSAGVCTSDTTRAVIVGNGGPPLPQADFTANVTCVNLFGFQQCTAAAGQIVTLTASPTSTTSYDWNFGDGTTGSGQTVTHTWTTPGTYAVQLAVSNARGTSSKVETFVITNGPVGGCVQSATRLCLVDNRFAVDVAWRTPQGTSGQGQAVQLTRDTGYFWFFNSANVEMVLKVLDACNGFNHFWVFAGGLTNVRVDITVTDTVAGTVKTYSNPQSTPFQPIQDTSAFATCGAKSAATSASAADLGPSPKFGTPSGTALLLGAGSRFKVETTWRTPQGTSGSGQAVQLTADTGYFWFFNSENVEMVVKVLDACSLNSRFWDFAGGLTNVQVDIKVTDTKNGTVKMYHNPQSTP